ncbi:MAG: chemotaxis protein CheW [Planctomycetes bacterium]|nr:chemotaxis protein CheW [Planctomycetota bacterium]
MIEEDSMDGRNENINDNSNHRLTAFAFHGTENGIDIKIIGCMEVRGAPSQPVYSKGIVLINEKAFSVFDLQALSGLKPKTITPESCIVLLDPNDTFTDFSRAIIVDDVSEMLRIAERDMDGLPVDTLFGRRWQCLPENPSPDFPNTTKESLQFNKIGDSNYSARKCAIGRN